MSEMSQNSLPNVCRAKTREGICKNLPMPNGRCRFHGGLTPKKHPNHQAKLNALKSGRYSIQTKMKIKELKTELQESESSRIVFFLFSLLLLQLIVQEESLTLFINSIITKNHKKTLTVIKNRRGIAGEN